MNFRNLCCFCGIWLSELILSKREFFGSFPQVTHVVPVITLERVIINFKYFLEIKNQRFVYLKLVQVSVIWYRLYVTEGAYRYV